MKKLKFIALTVLSTLTLASCSLFNDADIEIKNDFKKQESNQIVVTKDKIGDVYGVRSDDVKNTTIFKNLPYWNIGANTIANTYKSLPEPYDVNGGSDYEANKNVNNFDLYVPDGLNKNGAHNVVLFIHGGAWISGLKSHVNPYVQRFAKEGYIAATMEYTLLNKDVIDSTSTVKDVAGSPLSIFRDLDEIDACILKLKAGLGTLGFNESNLKLVLGGASSGAHLAMLYAYSRGGSSPMPINFLIDAVGPTDIQVNAWKAFKYTTDEEHEALINDGIENDKINSGNTKELLVAGQTYYWNDYQTMRIANGMCGMPYCINDVEDASTGGGTGVNPSKDVYKALVGDKNPISGEEYLSVTHWMTKDNVIPMICAYAGEDTVVGINQFATLQSKMEEPLINTEYEFFYFEHCGHVDLDKDTTTYNSFINKILEWMETK